jgi:D-amino peptidase
MKVYISCDIEGVATTTLWEQTDTIGKNAIAAPYAKQMTEEVNAACEGAIAAGADFILVKDAHGSGCNMDITRFPECVQVIRSGSGNPFSMADGVQTAPFDAAMFIGYHSAAGRCGNPLSHTFTTKTVWVKLNGVKCSEFRIFSWVAALNKVPTVLLAGDKMLCEDSRDIHPKCLFVPVKDGFGGMTRSIHPALACKRIKAAAEQALRQDLSGALCTLPEHYVFEICYKTHKDAVERSFFPGYKLIDDNTIRMETDAYWDVLRSIRYVL